MIIRLKRGEIVIKSLEKLALSQKIKSASFTGIGALGEVTLAHYNVAKKKYSTPKPDLR